MGQQELHHPCTLLPSVLGTQHWLGLYRPCFLLSPLFMKCLQGQRVKLELSRPASVFLLLRQKPEVGVGTQLFSLYSVGSEGHKGVLWGLCLIPCVSTLNHDGPNPKAGWG